MASTASRVPPVELSLVPEDSKWKIITVIGENHPNHHRANVLNQPVGAAPAFCSLAASARPPSRDGYSLQVSQREASLERPVVAEVIPTSVNWVCEGAAIRPMPMNCAGVVIEAPNEGIVSQPYFDYIMN